MGQTLTNGIYLPNEGERNCYSGLAANWNAVDTLKGNYSLHAINVDIHVTSAEKETWNGKADASALTAHTGDTTIHVTSADKQAWDGHVADTTIHVTSADKQAWNGHVADSVKHVTAEDKQAWNGKADASALTAHTGDTTIHVTAEDKEAWNGKADASALTAHTGDTTIHVTSADKQAWNGKADASALTAHTGDTTIHVTAADKAKWDAVTTKANDADAVHKSGAETIAGPKTFSDTVTVPSINGINPGSLSMPDLTAGVDISGYITAGISHNEYTPTVDGWISVTIKKTTTSGALALFIYQGGICNSYFGNTTLPDESEFTGMASIPVKAGIVVNIDTKGSNTYVYSAKFYPCQGNI